MLRHRLTLPVLLYLLLDLSSPFVPGAFTFEESLEATQHTSRSRSAAVVGAPATAKPVAWRDDHAPSRRATIRQRLATSEWIVIVRETHVGSYEPPPPEDH